MTVVPSGLIVAIAIGVLSTFGAGMQEKSEMPGDDPPSAYVQDTASEGLQLVVKTEKATFTPGEPIVLSVVARNHSAKPLFIVDTYHPEWDTKFQVRNEAEESAALTEDGERLTKSIAIFRDIRVEINPGDEVQKDFVINKLFEMTAPGTYSITVKRSFCFSGTDVFMVAMSNIIKVTIAG
jgi:hypothetical protein